MTIKSPQHPGHTTQFRWKRIRVTKAILGDIECGVGQVRVAAPIKLPPHLFQQIIEEHRAGKKSRI
jgi:hypothetical protein